MMRKIRMAFVVMFIVCGALAPVQVFASGEPPTPSVADRETECRNGWNQSSASQTCTVNRISSPADRPNTCSINATCQGVNKTVTGGITVSPRSAASSIYNCNGSMQTSAC